MDADKKKIWVSGQTIEVTDAVYEAYMKGDRKMRYFENDLKAERILLDEDGQIKQIILSREDSLDRLMDDNAEQWFRDRGQWTDASYEPSPGTIIFFDWEGDGVTDHTGIVQKCENGTVYTVEGNSGDTCRTKTYPVGSSVIYGYGIPAY